MFLAAAPALAQDSPASTPVAVIAPQAESAETQPAVTFLRLSDAAIGRHVTFVPAMDQAVPAGGQSASRQHLGVGGRGFIGPSNKGGGGVVQVRHEITHTDPRTPNDDHGFLPSPQASAGGPGYPVVITLIGEGGFYGLSGSPVISALGGARVCRHLNDQFAVFGQTLAGILHFSGATDFDLQPGGGVTIFPKGKSYRFDISIEFPIDIYDGGHEVNTQFGFTLVLPLGSK